MRARKMVWRDSGNDRDVCCILRSVEWLFAH